MAPPATDAERFARARQEFVEAMEAGCTILELRRRKAEARAALRHRAQAEVAERTADMMTDPTQQQGDFARWESPWMMRD
ncbi:hypothetical protein M529_11770 [Sphingobium ummariense RL-3]|uniref:Uncharacterized protein n=2 Tax=Sphingobium TaxID=165695 RepID=T0J232_9SPHN|nr:hypothetical protein M529_11770 [Sphingobium ummariense RL-3]